MTKPTMKESSGVQLLSALDVALRLKVSKRTVRRLIASGELEATRIRRSVRVSERALQALIMESATR